MILQHDNKTLNLEAVFMWLFNYGQFLAYILGQLGKTHPEIRTCCPFSPSLYTISCVLYAPRVKYTIFLQISKIQLVFFSSESTTQFEMPVRQIENWIVTIFSAPTKDGRPKILLIFLSLWSVFIGMKHPCIDVQGEGG